MDITALAAELAAGHPVTGSYDVDYIAARSQLYEKNIPEDVETVTGQDIFEAATRTDWLALTADQREMFYAIVGIDIILVNGTNTKAALLEMFGPATVTRSNLATLQTRLVSRVAQLRWGKVALSDIAKARV